MNDGAPTAGGVAIGGVEERLGRRFEQRVGVHVRFPERLAHAVELLGASSRHDEVLGLHGASDEVERADEGFVGLGLQTGDNGLDEVRAESTLVEQIRNHRHEGFRLDVPVLAEGVELQTELQPVVNRLDIGGESGQADVKLGSHFEDFREIHSNRLELDAVSEIGSDGDAVFSGHRDASTAVIRHDTHDDRFSMGER